MAVRDTTRRKLTYEDYALIPNDGLRHEILEGEHYVSPVPYVVHQTVSCALAAILYSFVREHRLGQVYFAPLDVLLSKHDIVQPDLLFISNERLDFRDDENIKGAPELLVEILSDATRRTDEGIKRRIYERSGVLEYWMVDPDDHTVRVLRRVGDSFGPVEHFSADAGDVLITPLLPGLTIQVSQIFER